MSRHFFFWLESWPDGWWYTFAIGQGKENPRDRECPETIVLYTCPFVDIANKVRTYDTLSVYIAEASQLSFKLFRLFIYFKKN